MFKQFTQHKARRLIQQVLLVGGVLTLSGCSTVFDKHVEWETVQPKVFPIVKAVGYAPISLQRGASESQKMILAIRSSKLDAYRELAEQVYGHNISASTSVKGMVARNDILKSKVNGLIRGAKVVKNYALGDIYTTELELDMKVVYALYKMQNRDRRLKNVRYY
ncbi:MAG: LPP20 family lipoprotein [Algicola sp.]|nr:LPP20 family lipoprotein [Algicola sp.]